MSPRTQRMRSMLYEPAELLKEANAMADALMRSHSRDLRELQITSRWSASIVCLMHRAWGR